MNSYLLSNTMTVVIIRIMKISINLLIILSTNISTNAVIDIDVLIEISIDIFIGNKFKNFYIEKFCYRYDEIDQYKRYAPYRYMHVHINVCIVQISTKILSN